MTWTHWYRIDKHVQPKEAHEKIDDLAYKCAQWQTAISNLWEPRWITLVGPSGNGKTTMADVLWKSTRRHRHLASAKCDWEPHKVFWPDMEAQLCEKNPDIAIQRKFRDMAKWPVVYLDDIYSSRDPWEQGKDKLFELLGKRVGRWTILTCNKTLNDIRDRDPRVSDRMLRGRNIVWNGEGVESFAIVNRV